LASDADFLHGLGKLICDGLGVPANQEAGFILLANLCTTVHTDMK
uniref:WAPL domain-containing protein n=1 Tax=Echinostoma caproni TaxID=27848 RepID=A0A183B5P4_9TREM